MGLRSTYRRCRFWQKKIIFLYEAHFDLGGCVNKQNCRILGQRKPAHIQKKAEPKTIHCLVRIFVQRHNWVIFLRKCVRRGRYSQWRLLSGHVERIFVHKNWRRGYWQHLVSRGHIAEATLDVLRRANVAWPPQSCDLTPLDYYLWDVVKDRCYADKPETIE